MWKYVYEITPNDGEKKTTAAHDVRIRHLEER